MNRTSGATKGADVETRSGTRRRALGRGRLAGVLACLVLSGAAGVAAQDEPPAGREEFAEETTVTLVEVPVQVLRGGEPVRGLTAEDFVIYDEGERRPVSYFEAVDLREAVAGSGEAAGPDEGAAEVPAAARRRFLLFFDLDFTAAPYIAQAQKAALHLVREGLRPTDLVGVAFFSGRQGGSSVIGFTSDRGEVIRALEALGELLGKTGERPAKGGRTAGRARDALGLTFGGWDVTAVDIGRAAEAERSLADETLDWGEAAGAGSQGDDTIPHMAAFAMEDMRQSRAAKAAALMGTLHDLARRTRFIEGAKYLLLFSQGFESYLYTEEGQSWLHTEIENAVEELRRAGWVLHGIETAASAGGYVPLQKRESLSMISQETGGELHARSNDLTDALREVLERTSVTYVLGFQTGPIPMDGSFRRLRVELADGVEGARLLHRTGYFTPRAPQDGDPETWAADAGELLLTAREVDEIGTAMVASPLRLTEGGARVPVLLEIQGAGLTAATGSVDAAGPIRTDLYVYAFDPGGAVTASLSRQLLLDPSRLPSADGGFKVVEQLDLLPGQHQVRVLLHVAGSGRVAMHTAILNVPASAAEPAQPFLLPPLFVQEPGEPWLLVRESEGAREPGASGRGRDDGEFPFVYEGRRFVPAASPTFSGAAARLLLVQGYGLPAGGEGLRVRVVNPLGDTVPGAKLELVGREQGQHGAPDAIALRLSTEALEPGRYAVEVGIPGRTPWTRGGPFLVAAAGL